MELLLVKNERKVMWRSMSNNVLFLLIPCFVLSCGRQNNALIPKGNIEQGCEDKAESTENKRTSVGGNIEDVFRHLVVATNLPLAEASGRTSDVIMEILRLSDEKKAFHFCDELLEMAISQEVTVTDYNRRQDWYAMLWHNAMYSFIGAQRKQGNDYAYWDKIFRFYAKYTNEIVSVENELSKVDRSKWSRSMVLKGVYLHGIKGELKTWVRVMRDFEFPKMNKNYTAEQKADILRRLKDVENYTITPPHYPGGKGGK
jgi:hypothetical protein